MTVAPILVLHDVGDPEGGAPWRRALRSAGWQGQVLAPDLPGHAGAPAPEGGQYDASDAAFVSVPLLAKLGEPCVVVGVGANGWNASLCGLGGKASTVVLVDGTGAPWITPLDAIKQERAWLRSIADDPEAVTPVPSGSSLDPRLLRHRPPAHGSRPLALRAASRMRVPLLLLESPASACPVSDAEEVAGAALGGGRVVRIDEASPEAVASALVGELVGEEQAQAR